MKRMLKSLLCVAVIAAMCVGCGTNTTKKTEETASSGGEAKGSYKVGITVQSLQNDYWAGVFASVESLLKEKGWEYTLVDCKDNSAEQISQIENFITAGCDMIMVHPSDPSAIEETCKQAMDAGIKVMSWDDKMKNTTVNWVLDNEKLGEAIGQAAAKFINEKYSESNKAEVAIMDYPQTPILLDRENGIISALEKDCAGKYEIVAQQPAIEANVAQSNMETILQKNPNCKIVCSIGAGGDIGANQAFLTQYNGEIPDDCGIFSPDATKQQMEAIANGEASRATIGFEGSNKRTAEAVVDMYEKILTNHDFGEQDVYRPILEINADNVAEYLADYKE